MLSHAHTFRPKGLLQRVAHRKHQQWRLTLNAIHVRHHHGGGAHTPEEERTPVTSGCHAELCIPWPFR